MGWFRVAPRVVAMAWSDPANAGQRTRRVAITLAFQARARLLGTTTRIPYGERSRIDARLDGFSSRRAAYSRLPDISEMRVWQRELRPGSLFVDVGANVGLYTVIACEARTEVIAVEPQRDAIEQLRANLALNGYEAEVVQQAVSEEAGRASLAGPDPNQQALVAGSDVEVTTIDRLVGERSVDGIKVDVEGAERLVLIGASRALSEHRVPFA